MSFINSFLINSDFDMSVNGNDGYQYYLVDATNGSKNVNLPTNYYNGLYLNFLRTDNTSNTVKFQAQGTGITINNSSNNIMGGNNYCEMIFQNNNWICPFFPVSY